MLEITDIRRLVRLGLRCYWCGDKDGLEFCRGVLCEDVLEWGGGDAYRAAWTLEALRRRM